MAVDMFLLMKGVDGETQDKVYKSKKAIDILAWSWGASQSGTTHMGSGGGGGKCSVQDISITKYVDSASNALWQHVCTGKHIEECEIIVRKAGGTPLEYIKIKMHECIITAVSTGGSGGEDRLTENISINFAKFTFAYQPQDEKGGKHGGEKTHTWNIAENAQ